MRVEVIAIGDELLIGQTINTNASWIGMELSMIGGSVEYATVIQDKEDAILDAVDRAMSRVDVTIITGGLGPTKDDITKYTLCKYFDTTLEINEDVLAHVKSFFDARGREMLDVNVQQAALPVGAKVLRNEMGTASGMWFEREGKILISLPGVPYEMKHLVADRIIPELKQRFKMDAIYHRTLHTQGIGESYLAEKIQDIEDNIRANGIGLAYLPSPGVVRLRLTSEMSNEKKEKIEQYIGEIEERLPQYVFSKESGDLAEIVGEILKEQGTTVGTVESCTAGSLASSLVASPGSSAYFQGSFLTYSNALKMKLVDVSEASLESFGAVSESVVTQMAQNGREKLEVDYCLATSGIAGPGGGSEEKPVGNVWIALATPEKVVAKRFLFGNHRERNIRKSVLTALNLLRCELLKINMEKSN